MSTQTFIKSVAHPAKSELRSLNCFGFHVNGQSFEFIEYFTADPFNKVFGTKRQNNIMSRTRVAVMIIGRMAHETHSKAKKHIAG